MADDNDFGDYLKAAAVLAVAVSASAALNSALAGKQKNAVENYPLNQPIMPVKNFVGDYSKTAGGYVFRQKVSNNFATIQAVSEGRLDSFNGFYLADDKVTLNGSDSVIGVTNGGTTITDGRYQDDDGKIRVKIQTRLGLPTETAYSDFTAAFPGVWDSTCRGDYTGSIAVQRFATDTKFQSQIFPAGPVDASVVARGVCFDWRDETQDRFDDTTWKWSRNSIVWLAHQEWTKWGRDWDTQIAPVLDDLTIEADYCETAFPLKAGGTQDIYGVAFNYPDDEEYTVTRQRILDAMDGWYAEDGFGRLILKAGRYEEPDLTFTGDDILASHWEGGELSSDAVDLINISFISPANDYKQVQCDPWIINEGSTLSTDMDLGGVDNLPQARYLGKRRAARLMPNYRGWIRVGRKGRQALKKRYIRVQNPRRPSMADVACEITGIEYDPGDRTFTINLISADPNIDAWNPATEEGDPVDTVPGVDPGVLDAPTITAVTPFYDGINIRLAVRGQFPARDDLTPVSSWRVPGGVWNDATATDYVDNGSYSYTANTGVVTADTALEVRLAYLTGGATLSEWSDVETVNSSVVPPSWADPGALWQVNLTSGDNRFWTGDTEYASWAAAVTATKASLTRSTSKLAANAAGVYSSFSTNVIATTDKGTSNEPAETNLLTYSDTLSNAAWIASAVTKTAGQTTPFGSDGALVTCNGASALHGLRRDSLSVTASQSYTLRYLVKAGGVPVCDRVQIAFGGAFSGTAYVNFYLNGSGSISASGAGTTGTIVLENGWYVITATAVASSTSSAAQGYINALASGGGATGTETRNPTLTLSSNFYVGRGEFVNGNTGTPIVTTTASVTRAADVMTVFPVAGTYDVTVTYADATTDTYTSQAITGSGWAVPTKLNSYITKIVGS